MKGWGGCNVTITINDLKVKTEEWPDYGLMLEPNEFFNWFIYEKNNNEEAKQESDNQNINTPLIHLIEGTY